MKRPKLVSKWKDQIYQIEVREYEYSNGVRVIEAINPSSIHFDFSVILRAGASYERQIGVPDGTAHMLEHILFGQPNKRQKSTKEINRYLYGTKTRPSVYANARTSKDHLYFYGSTHRKGASRLLKSMRYRLDYPLNKIENYIEEERSVILAEYTGKVREDRDERLVSLKYLLGDAYKDYQTRVIGDEESINSITPDHIRQFHAATFKAGNTVIAMQVHERLDADKWQEIGKIAELFEPGEANLDTPAAELSNAQYRYQHFQQPDNQSVFVSMSYFHKITKDIDYTEDVTWYLANSLINKVLFDRLRLDKQLIYSGRSVSSVITPHWRLRGLKIECRKDDYVQAINEIYEIINGGFAEFLDSEEGQQWFTSTISDYIFPTNQNYRSDYAEDPALGLLEGEDYKFDNRKADNAAREITVADLKQHMDTHFIGDLPSMWVVSPFPDEEIDGLMQQSIWHKKYHA